MKARKTTFAGRSGFLLLTCLLGASLTFKETDPAARKIEFNSSNATGNSDARHLLWPSVETGSLDVTWVRTSGFGDRNLQPRSIVKIKEAAELRFIWRTGWVDATSATWSLFRVDEGADAPSAFVASGILRNVPGGYFSIDLSQYLPSTRRPRHVAYHLIVQARIAMNNRAQMDAELGLQELLSRTLPLGPVSRPVVILY